MFGFFNSKKRAARKLAASFANKEISRDQYLLQLQAIGGDYWIKELTPVEKDIFALTKQYNIGAMTKDAYKEQIKSLDTAIWLTLATDEEKQIHNLENQHRYGDLTDGEFNMQMATLRKEPYIYVKNIIVDTGVVGRHGIEFDWNPHFITFLRANGFTGQSEEEVVEQWFIQFCAGMVNPEGSVVVSLPPLFEDHE